MVFGVPFSPFQNTAASSPAYRVRHGSSVRVSRMNLRTPTTLDYRGGRGGVPVPQKFSAAGSPTKDAGNQEAWVIGFSIWVSARKGAGGTAHELRRQKTTTRLWAKGHTGPQRATSHKHRATSPKGRMAQLIGMLGAGPRGARAWRWVRKNHGASHWRAVPTPWRVQRLPAAPAASLRAARVPWPRTRLPMPILHVHCLACLVKNWHRRCGGGSLRAGHHRPARDYELVNRRELDAKVASLDCVKGILGRRQSSWPG